MRTSILFFIAAFGPLMLFAQSRTPQNQAVNSQYAVQRTQGSSVSGQSSTVPSQTVSVQQSGTDHRSGANPVSGSVIRHKPVLTEQNIVPANAQKKGTVLRSAESGGRMEEVSVPAEIQPYYCVMQLPASYYVYNNRKFFPDAFTVQLGVYEDLEACRLVLKKYKRIFLVRGFIFEDEQYGESFFRLFLGHYREIRDAARLRSRVSAYFPNSIVVRLEF